MLKIICLVLFSLVCASDQYSLFSAGCGSRNSRSTSNDRPYSYTYDWFHRSGLNEVVGEPPRRKLVVEYFGNGESKRVNLGNRFTPEETKYQPYVWWRGDPSKHYCLVMIDPDAPEGAQIRHWLVINIKGNNLNTGDSISDYLGAGPPEGSGDHRYALLIYEQKARITDEFPIASSRSLYGRDSFNVQEFAKQHNLGTPLVANYFVAKYQKGYVEKFYEGLEYDEEDEEEHKEEHDE